MTTPANENGLNPLLETGSYVFVRIGMHVTSETDVRGVIGSLNRLMQSFSSKGDVALHVTVVNRQGQTWTQEYSFKESPSTPPAV